MSDAPVTLESIAHVAEALIAAEGTLGLDLHLLCQRLGCTEATLLRHFPGGLAQIERMLRVHLAATLSERLTAAEDDEAVRFGDLPPGSAALRMVRRARGFLASAAAGPGRHRFLFAPDRTGATNTPALALVSRFADLVQAAAQARELTRPSIGRSEAEATAALLLAYLHRVAELAAAKLVPSTQDHVVRVLVEGLGRAGFAVARNPAALEAAARPTFPAPATPQPVPSQPVVETGARRGAA